MGSHGTLALLTTTTLRVHPLPQAARAMRIPDLHAELVWRLVLALRERQLEAVAVNAQRRTDSARYDVDVLFEGFRAGVVAQIDSLRELASEQRWSAREISPEDASAADTRIRTAGPLRLRCTTLPSEFVANDGSCTVPLLDVLSEPVAISYPALGIVIVAGTPKARTTRNVLAAARADIERRGGSFVVEAQPDRGDLSLAMDPWGKPPPSFPLMRQLKARFDPQTRLAPSCFVGGL